MVKQTPDTQITVPDTRHKEANKMLGGLLRETESKKHRSLAVIVADADEIKVGITNSALTKVKDAIIRASFPNMHDRKFNSDVSDSALDMHSAHPGIIEVQDIAALDNDAISISELSMSHHNRRNNSHPTADKPVGPYIFIDSAQFEGLQSGNEHRDDNIRLINNEVDKLRDIFPRSPVIILKSREDDVRLQNSNELIAHTRPDLNVPDIRVSQRYGTINAHGNTIDSIEAALKVAENDVTNAFKTVEMTYRNEDGTLRGGQKRPEEGQSR